MKKNLIIILALVLMLGLAACGGSDGSDGDTGSKDSEYIPLEIIDSGYDITGEKGDYYLHYSIIIKNSNKDVGVESPSYRVTAYAKDDTVLGTYDHTLNSIYPGSELGYASQGPSLSEKPDRVEFEMMEPDDYSWKSGEDFEYPNFKPLVAEKTKIKEEFYGSMYSLTGQLLNENDYDIDSVAVSVLYKDDKGNLKGGDTTFVDGVKAGTKTPFETLGYYFDYKDYVIYTEPWY